MPSLVGSEMCIRDSTSRIAIKTYIMKQSIQNKTPIKSTKCSHCDSNQKLLKLESDKTEKLKKQNDKYREQLKEMSKELDLVLNDLKNTKKYEKVQKPLEDRLKQLKAELESATTLLESLKQQSKFLENKSHRDYNAEKVTILAAELEDKQKQLFLVQQQTLSLIHI
eukprot:TRINITY_DN20757_c0_g1_i1.p1 TRINITY_DN20757_c0_g1~~TRINITY_DN20757_c0_g1_i1.p1  ORF type:complete len:167 (+),score=30.45 TRINITY_DN20757_c0_g1_i1:145-645(+)